MPIVKKRFFFEAKENRKRFRLTVEEKEETRMYLLRVLVAISAIFWNESRKAVDELIVAFNWAWNLVAFTMKSSQTVTPLFISFMVKLKILASIFSYMRFARSWLFFSEKIFEIKKNEEILDTIFWSFKSTF